MKSFIIGSIRAYRKLYPVRLQIMRMFGASYEAECRFSPTCSEYTIRAVKKYGVALGLWKGLYRIVRCNPWSKGGYDPV